MHDLIDNAKDALGLDLPNLEKAYSETESNITRAKQTLEQDSRVRDSSELGTIALGSMARYEMTDGSDFDYLIVAYGLLENPEHLREYRKALEDVQSKLKAEPPGSTGTFGQLIAPSDLVDRIGLEGDTNQNTTRRVLLLEESISLHNDEKYQHLIEAILRRYLLDYDTPKKGVPRFLLNDVIRYWRTIAVDYQAKRWESLEEQWGLRYTKLRISRKIVFAGTLISLFRPALEGFETTAEYLREQFYMPPLARLVQICSYLQTEGTESANALSTILKIADEFVGALDDEGFRSEVKDVRRRADGERSEAFQRFRRKGDEFQSALESVFFKPKELGDIARKYLSF